MPEKKTHIPPHYQHKKHPRYVAKHKPIKHTYPTTVKLNGFLWRELWLNFHKYTER